MNSKQQIILSAEGLFMRYGLKSITMDDVAREMGISKKTLYQYVDNKKDLIDQVLIKYMQEELAFMEELRKDSKNAIEEMFSVSKHVTDMLREMKPGVMYDLQKYYRDSWSKMEVFHRQHIFTMIKENLEKGQGEGLYRKDFNSDIIARLFGGITMMIVDESHFLLKEFKTEKLYLEYIFYHLRGIVTPKGLKLLEKLS